MYYPTIKNFVSSKYFPNSVEDNIRQLYALPSTQVKDHRVKNTRKGKSTKDHQKKPPRCSRLLHSRPRSRSRLTIRFVYFKSISVKIFRMSSRSPKILSCLTRGTHQTSSLSCRGSLTSRLPKPICWSTITLVQVRRQRKAPSLIDLKSCSIKRRWDLLKKNLLKSSIRGTGWPISMKMNSKRSILSFLGS